MAGTSDADVDGGTIVGTVKATAPSRASSDSGPELDPAILLAAQQGDRVARGHVAARYLLRVQRYLSRLLGSRANHLDVEDVTQDAFLQVFRSLHRYQTDGRAKLSTWLFSIATHVGLDWLRKQDRHPRLLPLDEQLDGAGPDLILRYAIVRAVDPLPPDFKAAFILRYYNCLEYSEIAAALDVPEGTAKSRVHRAKEDVKAVLLGDSP